MSVSIPSGFDFDVDLDGDLSVSLPTSYSFELTRLPTIDVNFRPIEFRPIEIRPLDFSLRIKEVPSTRSHLPLNYKIGFSFLGREFACINLCGQGQFITEPYQPYPCEPRTINTGIRRLGNDTASDAGDGPA